MYSWSAPAGALADLVWPLRRRMREQGLTQRQVAAHLMCDRSRVSRALSGRELPPLERVRRIAELVGVGIEQTEQRWERAHALQQELERDLRGCAAGGMPPRGMADYRDFLRALDGLRVQRGLSQREVARRDSSRRLTRSTVGAVLRGDRSASLAVVAAYVRACGVGEQAVDAWRSAWWRLAYPHREWRLRMRAEGLRRCGVADCRLRWGPP
ncbi:helix-turn-helix domain-containing protein [Nocardiopsis sp. CNT-189]|uniref:helix-turn-helix transcriptional regulator n=1 Tax=Nocardiopsis oceanisediminis TaxID=2816862 RepID=UPI003B334A76